MQLESGAVAAEITHNPVPFPCRAFKDGAGKILYTVPRDGLFDGQLEALAGNIHQPSLLRRNPAYRKGNGPVTEVSVEVDPHIDADNLTLFQPACARDPMYDDLVD